MTPHTPNKLPQLSQPAPPPSPPTCLPPQLVLRSPHALYELLKPRQTYRKLHCELEEQSALAGHIFTALHPEAGGKMNITLDEMVAKLARNKVRRAPPAHLPATCPPIRLPACLPACPPACLPARLPAFVFVISLASPGFCRPGQESAAST